MHSKKRSHEEFIEEMNVINPNITILGKFKTTNDKIMCKCNICGHQWETRASHLLEGRGCRQCKIEKRKLTNDDFVKKLQNVNNNIIACEPYKHSKTKILFKCKIDGHEWMATPSSVLRGTGCPKCGNKQKGKKSLKTHEQFIIDLKKINPYIEVLGKYVNSKTKILFRCKIDNFEWMTTPSVVLSGEGCPKCGRQRISESRISNHNDFLKKLSLVNPNIIPLEKYSYSYTPILFQCKICKYEWKASPSSILAGHGCSICVGKKFNHDIFVEKMRSVNPNIKFLDQFINVNTQISCECIKCKHKWKSNPSNLLDGSGCPICRSSRGERKISAILSMHNIDFIPQKTFDGLLGINDGLLKYDFYLPNYNLLIEYHGKQHFVPIKFFGGDKQYEKQQEHDKRKREYAINNNMNLLEISYKDINNIEYILMNKLNSNCCFAD